VQPDPSELARLHDATLRAVRLDWGAGRADLELTAALTPSQSSLVRVQATEVTLLRCPRQAPWGWSASVNEVRIASTNSGGMRLEVAIQSGDVIEIEAKAVTMEVVA
jgi:hypothetical protein